MRQTKRTKHSIKPRPEIHSDFFTSSFCEAANCVEVAFQKSSYCEAGNCVEVSNCGCNMIMVRDSKDKTKQTLTFTRDEWIAFVKGVKQGEFDVE